MRKLRIAFFADMLVRDFDGCMRTIFQLIDRKPEEVEIKYFSGTMSSLDEKDSIIVPDMTIPLNKSYKVALPFLSRQSLKQALIDFKPDVIHISTPSALGRYAVNYAQNNNIKVSTIYHTHFISYVDFYLRSCKPMIPMVKRAIESSLKSFYNACDIVLVPTEVMKQDLKDIGVKEKKMTIWQRGLDHTIFNPAKKDLSFIQSMTGNKRPNVLFVSRLVWEKNLETLIRIYNLNELSGRPYNMLIAGDGVAAKSLKTRMENAVFLGSLDQNDLAIFYASSDVFLFPSISETYGSVVVEAMSCGTPCVIGNGGGTTSLIENNETGYVVDPYNESLYQEAILRILTNGRLKSYLSESAQLSTRFLDWSNLAYKFYDMLNGLVDQKQLVLPQQAA